MFSKLFCIIINKLSMSLIMFIYEHDLKKKFFKLAIQQVLFQKSKCKILTNVKM